ncbi:craniofacial development protein 2-like protein [Tanacetum coccineum]
MLVDSPLCCLYLLVGRIEAVDNDGYVRSCPSGLGEHLPETRWKGSRAREGNGYKLWYSGSSSARNGIGVVVAGRLKDDVRVTKRSDRIMAISVVIDGEAVNVIKVGLSDAEKKRFWDELDELVRECPADERPIIGGDLNGHIGAAADGYEGVHGGFGFGERNEEGSIILEFATAHDMVVANSFFKKSKAHLITFQSGVTTPKLTICWEEATQKGGDKEAEDFVEELERGGGRDF